MCLLWSLLNALRWSPEWSLSSLSSLSFMSSMVSPLSFTWQSQSTVTLLYSLVCLLFFLTVLMRIKWWSLHFDMVHVISVMKMMWSLISWFFCQVFSSHMERQSHTYVTWHKLDFCHWNSKYSRMVSMVCYCYQVCVLFQARLCWCYFDSLLITFFYFIDSCLM